MLEEFDDLISRLCANSPITQEEHRDRLFGQVLWSGVIVLCPSGWVMR